MAGRQRHGRHGLQRQLKAAAAVAVQRHREKGGSLVLYVLGRPPPPSTAGEQTSGRVGHPISSMAPMSAASPALGRMPASASTGNMHPCTPR